MTLQGEGILMTTHLSANTAPGRLTTLQSKDEEESSTRAATVRPESREKHPRRRVAQNTCRALVPRPHVIPTSTQPPLLYSPCPTIWRIAAAFCQSVKDSGHQDSWYSLVPPRLGHGRDHAADLAATAFIQSTRDRLRRTSTLNDDSRQSYTRALIATRTSIGHGRNDEALLAVMILACTAIIR